MPQLIPNQPPETEADVVTTKDVQGRTTTETTESTEEEATRAATEESGAPKSARETGERVVKGTEPKSR